MRLIPNDRALGWTPYAWLIYIVPFTVGPALKSRSTAIDWAITLAALAVFVALYFRGFWSSGRELLTIAAAMTAMGIAFWPVNYGAGAFFIYAASLAGNYERPKIAVRTIGVIAAIVVAQAWLIDIGIWNALWPFVFSLLIGAINLHYAQVGRANAKLRLAHEEIEHLAKLAERERIARDLHDLLGHTLSLIILKSELASKLADRDVERARDEIRDVERISRDALAQVRNAVRGYRSGGLQAEVEAARETLIAAGVTPETDVAAMTLPPAHEVVLALAIREAVTNVVRHANARRCRIALHREDERCVLVVSDDGRGGANAQGSGLAGMQERAESLGGTVTRDGSRGTTLTIALPVPRAEAPSLQESA